MVVDLLLLLFLVQRLREIGDSSVGLQARLMSFRLLVLMALFQSLIRSVFSLTNLEKIKVVSEAQRPLPALSSSPLSVWIFVELTALRLTEKRWKIVFALRL